MATKNRQVAVYLNPELEQKITQYCIDNSITREGKNGELIPILGTGILDYLTKGFIDNTLTNSQSITPLENTTNFNDNLELKSFITQYITGIIPSLVPSNIVTISEVETLIDNKLQRLITGFNTGNINGIVPSNIPDNRVHQEMFEEKNNSSEPVINGDGENKLIDIGDRQLPSDSQSPSVLPDTLCENIPTGETISGKTYQDSYNELKELVAKNYTITKAFKELNDSIYPNYPNKSSNYEIHYKWNKDNIKTFISRYESENNINDSLLDKFKTKEKTKE